MANRPLKNFIHNRFDIVVVMCLVDYALLVVVGNRRFIGLAVMLPVVSTVLTAHWATGSEGRWRDVGRAAMVVAALAAVVQSLHPASWLGATIVLIFGISIVISMVVLYDYVLLDDSATIQTMYAALGCYLMLGIVFALFDAGLAVLTGNFFTQPGPHSGGDYAYFSAVTMTTVGYGDLTPAADYARSMAVLEAVMGQMILVTLVARTVASVSHERWGERRRTRRGTSNATDDDTEATTD